MTTAPAKPTKQSTNAAGTRRLPDRHYVFVVTALAVFLVGIIVWRVPVSSYIVTAQIGWESPAGNESTTDLTVASSGKVDAAASLLAEISARELLREAVNAANCQAPSPVFASANALRDSDIDLLAKRLEVRVRQSTDTATTMEVRCESPHAEWAVAFLNQLVRKAVQPPESARQKPLTSSRELREARWRLDEARHYQRRALYELQNFMDDHFEQVTDELVASRDVGDSANERPTTAKLPTNDSFVNHEATSSDEAAATERSRLETEIVQVRLRRTRLMRQFTKDHPQVRDLTLQMNDLQSRLDNLPAPPTGTPSESRRSPFPSIEPPATAAANGEQIAPHPVTVSLGKEEMETYLALRSAEQVAAAASDEAQEAFEDQLHLLTASKTNEIRMSNARWIMVPARVAGRQGGTLSPTRVLLIGLASIACGMLMACLAGSLRQLLRVNAITDIQSVTNLPIIGQLSVDPTTQNASKLATRQRVVRWGTLGCELTLGLLALTFILAAMAGGPTITQFTDDPFGVFAETIVEAYRSRL